MEQSDHATEVHALCSELDEWKTEHAAIRGELEGCRDGVHNICTTCKVDSSGTIGECLELCTEALQQISGAYDVLCFVLHSSTDAQQCVAQLYLEN